MTDLFEGEALEAVGRAAAERAWAEGLTVRRPDGTVVPIPLVAEPEILSREALADAAAEAERILSGAVKLARALLVSGDARDRAALEEPFSGLEAEAMARLFDEAPLPVTMARVDFLVPEGGGPPRALELNATIPAMSGYADLAAFSWIRAAARARGKTPREENALVAACGSHMERLREALVGTYRARGGTRARPSIAVVARPGDAQIGELRRLAAHLRQMGHRAENLVPQDCVPEDWDVLYRHVWASRVDPAAPFARALRAPGRYVVANPVNGLLEAKALFARLSECAEDAALAARAGLDEAERAAAGRLPVTRRLEPAMAARVVAERERWVLKRSWDYGGKSVHLGAELAPDAWARVVEEALADRRGGGFVAQERIFASRRPATRVTPEGTTRAVLHRDLSTYCGLGPSRPSGSVVRAAASPIVNILGGGGLAPVIPEDIHEALR
ncbi:hypothetical protein [Anaeromyxobacter oryzae]|uniref:Glutathionylspermidine synthase pre-ATP-grasp-like domain-containing protein n=1 Tax=Anaeromyxobacter oryzae TaxID=2918170 RepID=A0ABM7WRW2_9BACT|nr:hypothetical protein [Anaeromyxobacter oryzae]BDG02191.1 hypothetical protein AMOR_11870 [Anaeromyxobacter oryzae]